jgi:hypothetical protein
MLSFAVVKVNSEKRARRTGDFYISTLAPVDHRRDARFGALDVAMLSVLFLELAVFMRLFLAN